MDQDLERQRVLHYLQETLEEPFSWTIENDADSDFAWILLRQRMIDGMQRADDRFGSYLTYEYDPLPLRLKNHVAIAFTKQDDTEFVPVDISDLEPWPTEEEIVEADWPPKKTGLTDATPYVRRQSGVRKFGRR
jgi:hypothetical protein